MLLRTAELSAHAEVPAGASDRGRAPDPRLALVGGQVHVGVHQVTRRDGPIANLVLLHDMSFIDRRSQDTRRYLLVFIAALGLAIALITMVVAQLSWRGWISGVRGLLRGEGLLRPLRGLARARADRRRAARRACATSRTSTGARWARRPPGTPIALRGCCARSCTATRSSWSPTASPTSTSASRAASSSSGPASGLVTAVEPVMRACSGTWIAHGSGSADRDVVDAHDRVARAAGSDEYLLRRIWLSAEEEQGYYYGFANEGMWPLCHVAHVRPVFRESDWEHYRTVNQRFADAVVAEARSEDPVVLVQDYHFALLPAMVRAQLPRATILTFWHIPWPNPESFGICPWRREILEGMLGSTILGFHTRFHCKNFIETVDRFLEARIEHEHSTISFKGDETLVESYPISIEWPPPRRSARLAVGRASAGAACSSAWPCRPTPAWPSASTASTTPRASSSACTRSSACSRSARNGSAASSSCRSPRRRAARSRSTSSSRSASRGVTAASTSASARPGYQPVHLLAEHHEHERRRPSCSAPPTSASSPACTTA